MKNVSIFEARSQFSEIINQVSYGKDPIILNRRGRKMCALVSLEDLALIMKTNLDGNDDSKENNG